MRKLKLSVLFFLLTSFYCFGQQAKYVFYFIGDGMGPAHVATTEAYLAATEDEIGFQKLSFTNFPATGFATTYAENRLITGSAAAGTALAAGQKTTINTIGMNADRSKNFKSIAEEARDNGFKVGIISSVSIDHATPASFYAHQPTRSMYYEISLDLPKSGFDFFGGGGFADPYKDNSVSTSVFEIAGLSGYTITSTRATFDSLQPGHGKIIAMGTKLESSGALPYAIDQNDADIPLEEFVDKAIAILDNENGFFIVCEEGKIDWAAHANDGASVIQNVISLSMSVEEALEFYYQHPDETLIVVTADHETGGLSMGSSRMKYDSDLKLLGKQKISFQNFSYLVDSVLVKKGEDKPTFEFVMGLVDAYFGLGGTNGSPLSEEELEIFYQAYLHSIGEVSSLNGINYGGYNPIAVTTTDILNQRAGIGWNSYSHTALPVPVFAIGVGHEMFNGYYDNTDIPKKIAEIMGMQNWSSGELK